MEFSLKEKKKDGVITEDKRSHIESELLCIMCKRCERLLQVEGQKLSIMSSVKAALSNSTETAPFMIILCAQTDS